MNLLADFLVGCEVSGGVLGELEHPASGTGMLNTHIRADPKTVLTDQQREVKFFTSG